MTIRTKKVGVLPKAGPLSGKEIIYILQDGISKQISASDLQDPFNGDLSDLILRIDTEEHARANGDLALVNTIAVTASQLITHISAEEASRIAADEALLAAIAASPGAIDGGCPSSSYSPSQFIDAGGP